MDYFYRAKAIKVIDGDTIDFSIDLGFKVFVKERIRLAGINTPETFGVLKESEEYKIGMKAKERVISLLFDENQNPIEIILETNKDKTEKYGRYIAWVHLNDGTILNELLVSEELAERVKY